MSKNKIATILKEYFIKEALEGKDPGLQEDTPLLAWGLLNSFETTKLLTFVKEALGVEIPYQALTAENLKSINAITHLLISIDPRLLLETKEVIHE